MVAVTKGGHTARRFVQHEVEGVVELEGPAVDLDGEGQGKVGNREVGTFGVLGQQLAGLRAGATKVAGKEFVELGHVHFLSLGQ